jgi:hypothetical protein
MHLSWLWLTLLVLSLWSLVRWLAQMWRAPGFIYAARLCIRRRRPATSRTYWRQIAGDFFLIRETTGANHLARRVEMWCPRLTEHFFQMFTTDRAGKWLEQIDSNGWRVINLQRLGDRFSGIEVTIQQESGFGARIVATGKHRLAAVDKV